MVYTQRHKIAIDKWKEKNRDKYNAICLVAQHKYILQNKDKIKIYKQKYWAYKKESEIFRNILI